MVIILKRKKKKPRKHIKCCQSVEKLEPSYTAGLNVKWCDIYGNSKTIPRKLNTGLPHDATIPLLGIYIKKNWGQILKQIFVHTFTAALVTITKRWKQPTCQAADEWINQLWYSHTMEYHSALKRNGGPTQATTWMNLKNLCWVKAARCERPHTAWSQLHEMPIYGKSIETEDLPWC